MTNQNAQDRRKFLKLPVAAASAACLLSDFTDADADFANQAPLSSGGWARPSDWPALPVLTTTSQEFAGLYAVYNSSSNFIALSATTSSGTYIVNWGDGSSPQTYASGTVAQYQYSYSASGLGALTSEGYKTAIVTVTPTSGNLIGFSLQQRNTTPATSYVSPWLDVSVGSPNFTSLNIGGSSVGLFMLQQVTIVNCGNITNMIYMFQYCSSLQSVPLFNTSAVTNMSYMFNNCPSLQSVPALNVSSVTSGNFSGIFQYCSSLQVAPLSGAQYSISFANCQLSASDLVNCLNGLSAAPAASQTVTITGNWGDNSGAPGYSALTTAIAAATANGWTVVH